MDQLEYPEDQIGTFSQRIEEVIRPFEKSPEAIMQIPGFDRRAAEVVIAEIGCETERFPTAHHPASRVGVCPGNNESAGKKKSGKTTKGNRWLRATLSQAAWAASCKKDSYFRAQYRRLAGRRGRKRALIAVAHSLLTVICHVLKNKTPYSDLGADYFDKLNANRLIRYHRKRLQDLGFEVTLNPREATV